MFGSLLGLGGDGLFVGLFGLGRDLFFWDCFYELFICRLIVYAIMLPFSVNFLDFFLHSFTFFFLLTLDPP